MAGWEDDLLKYLGRTEIKAQMHKFVVDARKRGVRFGGGAGGVVDDEEQARQIVENDILPRIVAAIQSRIPSMDKNMFLDVAKPEVNSEGAYVFHLQLDPRKTWRESLYDGGLDDIVAYMSHGAKPLRHWVAGYRIKTQGLSSMTGNYYFIPEGYVRLPDPFLETLEALLNVQFEADGVTVVLDDAYKPNGSSGATRGVSRH